MATAAADGSGHRLGATRRLTTILAMCPTLTHPGLDSLTLRYRGKIMASSNVTLRM